MVGVPYFNQNSAEYGWGLQGELLSVPAGFTYQTVIAYGHGIRGVRTIPDRNRKRVLQSYPENTFQILFPPANWVAFWVF